MAKETQGYLVIELEATSWRGFSRPPWPRSSTKERLRSSAGGELSPMVSGADRRNQAAAGEGGEEGALMWHG